MVATERLNTEIYSMLMWSAMLSSQLFTAFTNIDWISFSRSMRRPSTEHNFSSSTNTVS